MSPLITRHLGLTTLLFAGALAVTASGATAPLTINLSSTAVQEAAASPLKLGTNTTRDGHSYSLNSICFLRDGKPFFPVVGEMQYARIPRADWDDAILKMKNAGVDTIASYVFWLFHEEVEGEYDWTGNRSLRDFLEVCRKHDMLVMLRIGPWVHSELRNGGFPDWLLKDHGKVRSNDPLYMKTVDRYFGAMAAQTKGEYFKDGGPIIGIQLENEFPFEKEPAASYMFGLKKLARDHGIDVPLYTEFAWPGGPPGQTDFLPMRGRYPDAPWSNLLTRLVRDEVYRFEPVKFDPLIGEDLFGKRLGDTGALQPFPIAMAELGSGLQVNHRRRVLLNAADVVASAYIQLGCGSNMLGYYVFHGGMNPVGKHSTFQEAKEVAHITPNDVPMINYDFQAPLGMYGDAKPSFYQYRALHLFLNDFGDQLAPTTALFPSNPNKDINAIPPLRYCVRAKGDSGFVFVNNYRRFLETPDLPDIQFQIGTSTGPLKFPEKPCTVSHDRYFIWPFNLEMAGAKLRYATAQPLCIVPSSDEILYVFSSVDGIPPEYSFQAASVTSMQADPSARIDITKREGNYAVKLQEAGTSASFKLTAASGKKIRVLTLTRQQGYSASRVLWGGQARLVLAPGQVMSEDSVVRVQNVDSNVIAFSVYPNLGLQSSVPLQTSPDGILTRYTATLPLKPTVKVSAVPDPASSKIPYEGQNPPSYQPDFAQLPGAKTWAIQVPPNALDNCYDMILDVHYTGDVSALYSRNRVIMDQFNYNGVFPISLRHFMDKSAPNSLKMQILPFKADSPSYSDDASVLTKGLEASIEKIVAHPIYQISIKATH